MEKTSVLIAARNEKLLCSTVEHLRNSAAGELEIVIVLDGPTEFPVPENVKIIQLEKPVGLRSALDIGIQAVTGKYIFKTDAHCAFSQGFDKVLQESYQDNWVMTLRRYVADVVDGKVHALNPPTHPKTGIADYFYISCPWTHPSYKIMISCPWFKRTRYRPEPKIDETMGMQGAVWFASTDYCRKTLSNLGDPGLCFGDQLAIPLRTWLSGGQVMVNKDAWYAHPDNKSFVGFRGYAFTVGKSTTDVIKETEFWLSNKYKDGIHNFEWLVERFWPLPLSTTICYGEKYWWPEDWRKYVSTDRAV